MLNRKSDKIQVEGHVGTWYVIDEAVCTPPPEWEREPKSVRCFLLEHETHGDMAACLIVNESGTLILDDVWNGFDDLEEAGFGVERIEEQEAEAPAFTDLGMS